MSPAQLGEDSLLGNDSVPGDDGDDPIRRMVSCRLTASAEAALPQNLRSNRLPPVPRLRTGPPGANAAAAAAAFQDEAWQTARARGCPS